MRKQPLEPCKKGRVVERPLRCFLAARQAKLNRAKERAGFGRVAEEIDLWSRLGSRSSAPLVAEELVKVEPGWRPARCWCAVEACNELLRSGMMPSILVLQQVPKGPASSRATAKLLAGVDMPAAARAQL